MRDDEAKLELKSLHCEAVVCCTLKPPQEVEHLLTWPSSLVEDLLAQEVGVSHLAISMPISAPISAMIATMIATMVAMMPLSAVTTFPALGHVRKGPWKS